ncbi:MAG: hypothetical protein ACRCZI_09585, partial [Cetobacterium sp.]
LEVNTSVGGKLQWRQGLRALLSAAGDLLVASATGVGAILGIGPNNAVLVSDAAAALKMAWKTTLDGLTLNSPAINTPTISGGTLNSPTINTPTISGGTMSGTTISGGSISGVTLSGVTLSSPTITGNTVGTGALKTATGSTSGVTGVDLNITMNDYSFFPMLFRTGAGVGDASVLNFIGADSSNTIGRLQLEGGAAGSPVGSHGARWRYVTASDMPEIWVAYTPTTGGIMAAWASDDPPPGDVPGVEVPGCTSVRLTAKDLEHFSILNSKSKQAEDIIRGTGRRIQHQAYRALQLHANDEAPSLWLLNNCSINPANGKLRLK